MKTQPASRFAENEEEKQKRIEKVTRIVAIVVAFLGTFFFFIKLVFL